MTMTVEHATSRLRALNNLRALPDEVEEAMSILDEAFPPLADRRTTDRYRYRVQAVLKLPHERLGWTYRKVYTRDVNRRDAGFLTDAALPSKSAATLEIAAPDGRKLHLDCTVRRCREVLPGWYEGVVHFDHEEPDFHLGA